MGSRAGRKMLAFKPPSHKTNLMPQLDHKVYLHDFSWKVILNSLKYYLHPTYKAGHQKSMATIMLIPILDVASAISRLHHTDSKRWACFVKTHDKQWKK